MVSILLFVPTIAISAAAKFVNITLTASVLVPALATDIKLSQFELSDLAKLINGKEVIVDVKTEKQEGRQDRSVVDVTKNQIYYPLSEAASVFGDDAESSDDTINASDSIDPKINMDDVEEVF